MTLAREQTIAIAALALLIFVALSGVSLCLKLRADAVEELAEQSDVLAHLEKSLRARAETRGPPTAAPAAAFAQAPSEGLASAAIQAYIARVAGEQRGVLISSGVESAKSLDKSLDKSPDKSPDAPGAIELQITLDAGTNALQAILHRLESGTPYVFVRSLTVQPVAAAARRTPEDPLLHATLTLQTMWRRSTPSGAAGSAP